MMTSAETRPTYITEYAGIGRNSKKDTRRVRVRDMRNGMIWHPSHCRKLSKVTGKGQKVVDNGLGGLLPGGGVTLEMWVGHGAMR